MHGSLYPILHYLFTPPLNLTATALNSNCFDINQPVSYLFMS